ncbi:MAG: hypothetical protein O3A46_06925, partial [Candidatus Poribacteria bacterium]|nr:hypothetical protein [Candidatus Poribacteria bacterium]
LGAFHHYTTVTVDGDQAEIAIIEPGNVHPHDIATREFTDTARRALSFDTEIDLDAGTGKLIAHMRNDLDRQMMFQVTFFLPDGTDEWVEKRGRGNWHDPYLDTPPRSSWTVSPRQVRTFVDPGETYDFAFDVSFSPDDLAPFPAYWHSVSYDGKFMWQNTNQLPPLSLNDFTSIREWKTVGPFDLGIPEPLPTDGKWEHSLVPNFLEPGDVEKKWDAAEYVSGSKSVAWKDATASESGLLDFEELYGGDNVYAYGRAYVQSPDDRHVLSAVWADDAATVFINGEAVFPYIGYTDRNHPYYFMLPLKKGWNAVLVKVADTYKAWGSTLRVADTRGELRWARQPSD